MIRVLRLIEYNYADVERMTSDMARWMHAHTDGGMSMQSTALSPVVVDDLAVAPSPRTCSDCGHLIPPNRAVHRDGECIESESTLPLEPNGGRTWPDVPRSGM